MRDELLLAVTTPLDFNVHITKEYWKIIVEIKHPIMKNQEIKVKETLFNPDEIRKSRSDPSVYLFYKKIKSKRWICVVVRRLEDKGFLITTYPTDNIKEGEVLWKK